MSDFKLSSRSRSHLMDVHNDMVRVVNRAIEITNIDFAVIEGVRSLDRQKVLFSNKATLTLKSKHLHGLAVDLGAYVDGRIRWDWPLYHQIADAMKQAASDLNVDIVAGADWKHFPDGPHFELSGDYKEWIANFKLT